MELVRRRPAPPARRAWIAAAPVLAALAASGGGSPAAAAEPRMRTMSTYAQQRIEIDGRTISYYQARPQGEGPWRGLVLAHDSMGVDKTLTGLADRLAAQGFLVFAPDLYQGKIALDADKGREMAILADTTEGAAILAAIAGYVKYLPEVGDHRVGLLGIGFGGRVALAGGGASTDLSAVALVCPSPVTDVEALRRIGVPIQAWFGENDAAVKPSEIEAFRAALKEASRDATITVYPGAGHDFLMQPPEGHRAEAPGQAWASLIAFLTGRL